MTAGDLAQSISRELPFLRRYARALTGSQTAGVETSTCTMPAGWHSTSDPTDANANV